jgi:hypothetical protein
VVIAHRPVVWQPQGQCQCEQLLRRYQLYARAKAVLALPPGLEHVAALHAEKIGDHKKH